MNRPNYAPEIKRALTDPTRVLEGLGLLGQGRARQRQAGGWVIRCPVHADKTPSCSVQLKQGLLVWKCHGCQADGDALTLVAVARGLSLKREFRTVLIEAARLAGLWPIVDALERRDRPTIAPTPRPPPRTPEAEPERGYPDSGEVSSFWALSEPPSGVGEVAAYLRRRTIDPDAVDARDLARAIPREGMIPSWAVCRDGDWRASGYRLIVPMFDPGGELRSVRGWRVTDGEGPKRRPPFGHKAAGLVMADAFAIAMLRGQRVPDRVLLVEGEPDFLTWATRLNDPSTATLGIVSGSWTKELGDRFPIGVHVDIRVDHDEAGNRYFEEIARGLKRRTPDVRRSKEAA